MKIYTRKGDEGETSLVDGSKVPKTDLRLHTYGTLDELNSHVGLLASFIKNEAGLDLARTHLSDIQTWLFQLGSQLACSDAEMAKALPTIKEENIQSLENWIDELDKDLPALKNFILPGGHLGASQAHICRTVCRRAERRCALLHEKAPLNYPALSFLNRLSDYFFVLARHVNFKTNNADVEWVP